MGDEEEESQGLRRSKRNQLPKEEGGPNNPPQEKSGLEEFIRSAWKSVRRDLCEQQNSQIKHQWLQNAQTLERNLQSHKSFYHLHNATRLVRNRNKGLQMKEADTKTPCTFIPSHMTTIGLPATVTIFRDEINNTTINNSKKRGRGRPVLRSSTNNSPQTDVQKFKIRTLGYVKSIPPVVSWTAIPFNVAEEDGKFLTNIPFLGDELIDHKFIDDMLNLYQGNLHNLNHDSMNSCHKALDDHSLFNLVQKVQKLKPDVLPTLELFNAISQRFRSGSGEKLYEKYLSFVVKKEVVGVVDKPKPFVQDPSTYLIPNIDGPFAKDLPRESVMHAFGVLFCRRCYQYDCPRGHNGDDQIDLFECKKTRISQPNLTAIYDCKDANCWKKTEESGESSSSETNSSWSPSDKSLFRALISSFPDPCYVANLMMNKTCRQVRNFFLETEKESVKIKEEEESSPTTSLAPPPKKKSKKSSSVSKKNLSRRWINSVKRSEKGEQGGLCLPPRYMPCTHHNSENPECDEKNPNCYCGKNGTMCEKFCACPSTCKIRFPGCRCTSNCASRRCVCFLAARECDPDLCSGCGAHEHDKGNITCRNVNIQRQLHKHLLMGRSDVAGWGIFIKEDAQKGEFIAEYRGEIISHDESERRGHVYDKIQHTFLFELNDHFVVDATRKGNKARFVNSSKSPNCDVKRMLVNGDHRIGIYAKRFIDAGEELFYDYEDVLEKQQKVGSTKTK